ncbi:MAG: hypothetical protein IPF56_10920 [Chloroflexi bacterium]|nr:hypothetical protein [Chloroflexota bacterium]
MIVIPVAAVFRAFNKPLSFFWRSARSIYVFIYTIWLKPRTLLNFLSSLRRGGGTPTVFNSAPPPVPGTALAR